MRSALGHIVHRPIAKVTIPAVALALLTGGLLYVAGIDSDEIALRYVAADNAERVAAAAARGRWPMSVAWSSLGEFLKEGMAAPRKPPSVEHRLSEYLMKYEDDLSLAEQRAQADPGNDDTQRDLSGLHSKIGDLLAAQGNLSQALQSYRDALAVADRQARDMPNAQWQCELFASYEKIGNVLAVQGDLQQARSYYRDGLAIAVGLPKDKQSDPKLLTAMRHSPVWRSTDAWSATGNPCDATPWVGTAKR